MSYCYPCCPDCSHSEWQSYNTIEVGTMLFHLGEHFMHHLRSIKSLDAVAAGVGCFVGGVATVAALVIGGRSELLLYGATLFVACLLYFILRNRLIDEEDPKFRGGIFFSRLNNIVFVISFTVSILLLMTNVYSRPLSYFILISLCSVSIAMEIVRDPNRNQWLSSLLKIVLVGINLKAGLFYAFPITGEDALFFQHMIGQTANSGHVASSYFFGPNTYLYFPHSIIFVTNLQVILGLGVRDISFVSIVWLNILMTLFIFILARRLGHIRQALIAALFVNLSGHLVFYSAMFMLSTVFGFYIITLLLFLILGRRESPTIAMQLLIFSMIFLITSHIVSSIYGFVIILCVWVSVQIYYHYIQPSYKMITEKTPTMVSGTFVMLTAVLMLGYWSWAFYIPGHSALKTLITTVAWWLTTDIPFVSVVPATITDISLGETLLSMLGSLVLVALIALGCLAWLKPKSMDVNRLTMVVIVLVIALIVYGGKLFHITTPGMLGRLLLLLQILGSIPAALGILSLLRFFTNRRLRSMLLIVLVFVLSFFTITSLVANPESSLYAKELCARPGITSAERIAGEALLADFNDVQTDTYYGAVLPFLVEKRINAKPLNFSDLNQGLVILRSYAVENPRILASISPREFDINPKERLDGDKNYALIYDNGSVRAYLKQRGS